MGSEESLALVPGIEAHREFSVEGPARHVAGAAEGSRGIHERRVVGVGRS